MGEALHFFAKFPPASAQGTAAGGPLIPHDPGTMHEIPATRQAEKGVGLLRHSQQAHAPVVSFFDGVLQGTNSMSAC